MSVQPDLAPAPADRRQPRPKVALVVVVVVTLVAVVVAALLFDRWRSPDVFAPSSETYGDNDWPVGEPMYIGVTHERRAAQGSVTLRDADALVGRDDAHAVIEYFVCTVDPSSGIGSIGASNSSDIERQCSALDPLAGQSMELNADPRQQVVMSVTATEPGATVIDGTDLHYGFGWQRGTQRLDVGLTLKAVE